MVEKEVSFLDKQGRKIVGTLLIPDGTGSFPVAIVCHGFKGNRNQTHIKAIAEEISNKGLATLRIDFTKTPGESSLPFEEMTVSYELEVLDQAVNFAKQQKEVNPTKIGLAGHSLGGLVVAWYCAEHPEIKSLVTLSAVYSFKETFERHYGEWVKEAKEKGFGYIFSRSSNRNLKLLKVFYDEGLNYEMDKVIEDIACPVLVICGTGDSLLSHSQNYLDRLIVEDKELKAIKSADHDYSKPGNLDEVKTAVASWFEKTLRD